MVSRVRPPVRKRKAAKAKTIAAVPAKPALKISESVLAYSRQKPKQKFDHSAMFAAAKPMPGVVPKGHSTLAMDDAINTSISWATNNLYNVPFQEGWTFLGYPYLAELSVIPEYRLISDVISTEATRKWIKIQSASDTKGQDEAKSAKIEELEDELDRLGARAAFKEISEHDGFFGRSHLYIDTGSTDDRAELLKPIGDGNEFSEKKFKPGFLRALKTIEPIWCYPARYNASDPLADNWYRPGSWFALGKELDASRLLTFVAREVPDQLKPAFSFGGLSLSQMAKPYVDNWLQTRQSVNDLIQAFSTMVLSTDMSTILQGGGAEALQNRAELFNNLRNNRGLMMLNKDTELFQNVSAPLGSLDKLQAQAQEHMAAISRIPLVKLLGITPSGLNASSDGEIRVFYDTIHAYQESFFKDHLDTVFKLAQINIWGEVDEDLEWMFEPLWEMDEKTLTDMRKTQAETSQIYLDTGVTAPVEERQRLADEPESPYASLNVEDVPEPSAEEMEELGKAAAGFGKGKASEEQADQGEQDEARKAT